MYAKKNSGKKVIALLLILVLLIGCTIGATVAYLKTATAPVTNTFVAGNIGTLTLMETDTDANTDGIQHEYVIIPGKTISKDPKVSYTRAADHDVGDVYIFVQVKGGAWTYNATSNQFTADKLSWNVAADWTYLDKSDNVFYITASANVTDKDIISGNSITVGTDITKDTMNDAVTAASGLTFTAYAIQKEGFADAAAAWVQAQTASN